MVPSFFGRFVQIGPEAHIDVDREVQERQDVSLDVGEGALL